MTLAIGLLLLAGGSPLVKESRYLNPEHCFPLERFQQVYAREGGWAKAHEVGAWGGRRILDLHWERGEEGGKLLLVEGNQGEFCSIHSVGKPDDCLALSRSFIFDAAGRRILGTRCRSAGSGAFYDEAYWALDADGLKRIETEPLIAKALDELLPEGRGVWKGYGLNLQRMCYSMPVWNEETDPNCCPTGGWVLLKFELLGDELVLSSMEYDPKAAAPGYHKVECPAADEGKPFEERVR